MISLHVQEIQNLLQMQELAVLQTPNYDLYAIKLSVVPLQVQKSSVCFNSINQDTSKKAAITVKQFLPGFRDTDEL